MGIYKKSALLSLLRMRLAEDRSRDWQALQRRDREWFQSQSTARRWPLLQGWLQEFARLDVGPLAATTLVLNLLGLLAGFSLVAGLLEFQTFERINLLWFLAIAIATPFLFWVFGLIVAAGNGGFALFSLLEHYLPNWIRNPALMTLLRQTVVVLSQQLSFVFSLGMLLAMGLYLLVTDLAFGWSSTLDLSPQSLHALTSLLALPWNYLWPDAVPALSLVEQTQYFRSAPAAATAPAVLGEWWRFLLMCLVTYVFLPRLISYIWQRTKLSAMQSRLFDNDALIAGWWQRMTDTAVSQQAQPVEQRGHLAHSVPETTRLPVCRHVVLWGIWPDEEWTSIRQQLHIKVPDFQLYKVQDAQLMESTIGGIEREPTESVLIVCKGWEPPSGELADFCVRIVRGSAARFIWPVPLQGMSQNRIDQLNQSWRAFVPQLPEGYSLFLGADDD